MYIRHYRTLLNLAMRRVGDTGRAEDVVQQAFLALYEAWPRLRSTDKALSFLVRSVTRPSWALGVEELTAAPEIVRSVLPNMPSAEDIAIERLGPPPVHPAVAAALERLPARQQEALMLRYYGDLSDAEIAQVMHIPIGAVRSLASRAIVTLSRNLTGDEDTPKVYIRARGESLVGSRNRASSTSGVEGGRVKRRRQPAEGGSGAGDGGHGPGEPGPDRHLVGEFPGRVRAGTEFSLVVSIMSGPPEYGTSAAPVPDLAVGPAGVRVTFVIRPDAELLTLGELQQTVVLPQHGDSPPARFAFRARGVGLSRIRVTSWLGGTFLAELRLEVSVESDTPMADSQRRGAPLGSMHADPGEVTLQVHSDGAQYSFQLLSQRYLFGPVLAKSLTERPGQAVERTVAMLRKMARDASAYSPSLAARWVRETGIGLWHDLVPQSVQDQFWQLRDSITAFTIACDDDTVPWELLYPLAPGEEDVGFLVEQFPVLRRVYDQRRSHRVWLGDARYVVPPEAPTNAHDEVAAICRILGQPMSPSITHLASLLDLLDAGGSGMLHFACHNTFSAEAGGSSIPMADGRFVPQLLNSAAARHPLANSSPLIFVNACRSAGVSAEYTQMMGWASQYMAAGAGAFIGTLWPVSSQQASRFATVFYRAFVEGADLGQATLTARRATKDDGDPTWLAYTTYGDPAAFGVTAA